MSEEKTVQSEIAGYISTLLRKNFGKGPTSVYVVVKRPYVVIHFRGFISPVEKTLLAQDEWQRVLEIRDLLMDDLKSQILAELLKITELNFTELYADWNLSLQTGLFIGVMEEDLSAKDSGWTKERDKETFHAGIEQVNEAAERKPGLIESIWLNDRTLLAKRYKILVGIEKALIDQGHSEVLKLAKRPLERRLLDEASLNEVLQKEITEIFMDWNFEEDVGYIVFIFEPGTHHRKI